MEKFFLEISHEVFSTILKLAGVILGIVFTNIGRKYLKSQEDMASNQKKMTEDIHEIKTMVTVINTRYEGVVKSVEDVKERVVQLEDVVYKR
jgi:uncharacterized membrane protein (DUF106 family)